MRIRPVTLLPLPKIRVSGSASVNGAAQTIPGFGALSFRAPQIQGSATVHVATGQITASGAVALKRIRIASTALAVRKSVGAGLVRPKAPIVSGTAVRIDAESAVVQLFNEQGNPSGYGPSDDPNGVLYGMTGLANGDVYWFHNVPVGATPTLFAGGSYTLAISPSMAPGTYELGWTLRIALTGARSTGSKYFVVA